MVSKEHIWELAERYLSGSDRYVTDVSVKSGNIITIVIDSDTSVLIDDCVNLSRFIESSLDRTREDFELIVTSYGADRPLRFLRQYRKNIGRQLKVLTRDQGTFQGKLTEVTDEYILLEVIPEKTGKTKLTAKQLQQIPFDSITSARVILDFSK